MTEFMMRLRALARKHMLSVMVSLCGFSLASLMSIPSKVLNGSARMSAPDQPPKQYLLSHFPGNSRPALGSTFTFLADGTLWMTKYNGEMGNVRARDGRDIDEKEVRIVEMVKGRYTVRFSPNGETASC
jgi:hypothetical protein